MKKKPTNEKIETIPTWTTRRMKVAELRPADYNPRKISERAMKGLRASLSKFGELGGIVWNERTGQLVGGHQRVKALVQLGVEEVDVRVVSLTVEDERSANLALNHAGIGGEWDEALLRAVLEEAKRDMPTAFEELQLGDLWGEAADVVTDGLTDEEDTPEPLAEAVTVLGDVWLLGAHRIICGDSTSADVVGRLLGDTRPHLMVTDPPYGVEYDANWRNEAQRADGTKIGASAISKVENDDRADWREAWALFPGDVAYVWHASTNTAVVAQSIIDCGLKMRALIVWGKSQFAIGRGDYHLQHEPCWYAVRDGKTGHWNGSRKETTLWSIDKPRKSETGHSTQKPVECMRRPIENNSNPGDAVYEPFSGSGTTIIACEQTGRVCYAVELNPPYVDIAIQRWQAFTGHSATLDGDGRTWSEVRKARHVASGAGLTRKERKGPT